MKILQVLCGSEWGGGSVVVLAITRALVARGDQVHVLSFQDYSDRQFIEAGARIVHPPFWFRPINPLDAILFAYLAHLCWRERFDLVATHTSKGGFLGRFAARLAGTPHIVHHAHGFAFNKQLGPAARRFYVWLERLAAPAGDLIVSVNEGQRQLALQLKVDTPERIRTVHNGIRLEPYLVADRRETRRRLNFQDSDLVVGAVGRLAPQKGFIHLIRAMPRLLAAAPAARLVIAGEGPLELALRKEAQTSGAGERIQFLGFRTDIPDLLAAFDVFALPSLWEGLSISLMEALAAGKPIVASDIDANREVIGHGETGFLVPVADSAALADSLRLILTDAGLARTLGFNARQAARARFSEERMVGEILGVYDGLFGAAGGRAVRAAAAAEGMN